jgi:hypothetical protein
MAATPEHASSAPRFLTPIKNGTETGRPVNSNRDLLLTYFEILMECVRPRKVWQVGNALGIANIRAKRHMTVLLDANLLRIVEMGESTNPSDRNQKRENNAKSFMCTPLANHFFEALGDYYRKYRGKKFSKATVQTTHSTLEPK